MNFPFIAFAITLFCIFPLSAGDWPCWRGPTSDGIAVEPTIPTEWSLTHNIAWKVAVPGSGHSSPVVGANRIFLTSCINKDRCVLAFDAETGKSLWATRVETAEIEKMHKNNSPASSTPVTDGNHVWATFLIGSDISVVCLDVSGRIVWKQTFPGFACHHGICSSPTLFGDRLIINGDSDGDAFLAALNKSTGKVIWRTERENRTRSYSVPVPIYVNNQEQLVLAGSKTISSYEPATGKRIWFVNSPTDKFVSTVAYVDGLIIATGTSPVSTITAIRPNGHGDITNTHVLWTSSRGAAYVPSPLAVGKNLFIQADDGRATYLEAATGKRIWFERVGKGHLSSPLLINQLIYTLDQDGIMHVIKPGNEIDIISKNSIGETCYATPAVANGRLYIRSESHLWCIRK